MPADPPLVSYYLLEQPLPTVAALLLLTGVLVIAAMRRGSKGLLIGSLVTGPLLAVGLWTTASLVTTPREQVMELTRQLVEATSPLDAATLDRLLDADAVLLGPEGGAWLTRAQFDPIIRLVLERYPISHNQPRMLGADVIGDGRGARVLLDVTTRLDTQAYGERPIQTRWLIEWLRPADAQESDAWRVIRVRWLEHPGAAAVQPQREVWSSAG
jgi:hypothetical protein